MKKSTLSRAGIFSLVGLSFALALGCDKKEDEHHEESAASDAGARKVSDEPDLDKAVASVAAAKGAPNGASGPDGPPPNGIFAPGGADKALAKGAPAIFTLGSDGSEPRVQLGPVPKAGAKHSGTIEVASQSGEQGAIPVSFAVTIEVQKPKPDSDAGASPIQAVVKVTGATINAPGVPPEIAASVSKLKGSHVDFQLSPDGAGSNFHYEVAKGVDPGLTSSVQSLSDNLMLLVLPFPSKPVGVGAYWMVTTRDVVNGIDVVTYRLVKVEKVEGNAATLSVNTKRYAASSAFDIEGLPPGVPHSMSEFQGGCQGNLVVNAGDWFAKSGELDSMLAAALGAADPKTKQRPMVQLQGRAVVNF
ncbi:MAG TPA: hypothetical protein VHV51_23645 [Polyangiaceae bacterium]|nr:hypothetical protein [Polyangiaceae bacterium]